MAACGKPFSVEFTGDDSTTIRMSKAQEQTLWIPVDNRADEVQLTVVGSEETGNISVAYRGKLTTRLSSTDLEQQLTEMLNNSEI